MAACVRPADGGAVFAPLPAAAAISAVGPSMDSMTFSNDGSSINDQ